MLILALSKNERLFNLILSFFFLSKEAQPAVNSISLTIL